eukprot:2934562-Pyramimonas_sp.AAC.3
MQNQVRSTRDKLVVAHNKCRTGSHLAKPRKQNQKAVYRHFTTFRATLFRHVTCRCITARVRLQLVVENRGFQVRQLPLAASGARKTATRAALRANRRLP